MNKLLTSVFIVIFILIGCNKETKKATVKVDKVKIPKIEQFEKEKTNQQQIKKDTIKTEQKIEINKVDSLEQNRENFREHKSIHQIEWEEHNKDRKKDTIETKIETTKVETVKFEE